MSRKKKWVKQAPSARSVSAAKWRKQGYKATKDGQAEHREIYRQHFGRIPRGWVIHHVNSVRDDNRPENLVAMPTHLHDYLHKVQTAERKHFSKELIERVTLHLEGNENEIVKWVLELERQITWHRARIKQLGILELDGVTHLADPYPPEIPAPVKKDFQPKTVLRKKD